MKTQTIAAAELAMLVDAGSHFSVSAQAEEAGWRVYVRDQQGDRALLDLEGKTAAIFDALEAVEQRLLGLGIQHFEVEPLRKEAGYDEWLEAEIQEALNEPGPLIPHEEAVRQILDAIRVK
jgi:hypothetical protein